MDEEILVREVRQMANAIIEDNGPVCMLALWKDIDGDNTFSLIISAKWLDDKDIYSGTKQIVEYIWKYISAGCQKQISRATLVHTDDPYIRTINSVFAVSSSVVTMIDCRINNIVIPYIIVFESQRS